MKAEILRRHPGHQKLLEKDTISAIAIIVGTGLFPISTYRDKTTVQHNKDINVHRQIIIDRVKDKDFLGAMRAFKKELDRATELAEQAGRE